MCVNGFFTNIDAVWHADKVLNVFSVLYIIVNRSYTMYYELRFTMCKYKHYPITDICFLRLTNNHYWSKNYYIILHTATNFLQLHEWCKRFIVVQQEIFTESFGSFK